MSTRTRLRVYDALEDERDEDAISQTEDDLEELRRRRQKVWGARTFNEDTRAARRSMLAILERQIAEHEATLDELRGEA